ncbi:MAG: ABC transporter substrate-binding protein [Lachnospiraceae bacterium]|nr:ABC transporter substrate-binding protein [Lachnospiraceae bacterium]
MKKILSLALVAAMTVGCLAGCGKKSDSGSGSGSGSGSKSGSDGKVYFLNFKPEAEKAWQKLAKAYTKETGVDVKVETAASGTYEETLRAGMDKKDAPTLFQINGPVGLATWKDYCYNMADSDFYGELTSDDFALKGDNGEVLGIAYCVETYGIIYNKTILDTYFTKDYAACKSVEEINGFDMLKKVADSIQENKADLGVEGAFTSAGMDSSSDWRFKTHLANLPLYYEFQAEKYKGQPEKIKGSFIDNYKKIWDLYITDATVDSKLLSSKTGDEATSEFALGKAVFYQNGTWAWGDLSKAGMTGDQLGMLPIYIGADGEDKQGLCTGSENYMCVNANASEADIKATLDFMKWLVTSETGTTALAVDMGFVCPFKSAKQSDNPLIQIADKYIADGKTSVSWNFPAIPSEEWKDGVGAALTEYAQGTGEWDAVKKAFVDGWATEVEATKALQ